LSTLFAFLHHLAAFTLVSALAIEFVLIGQIQTKDATTGEGLSVPVAKRLVITDTVLGAAATILLVVGLLRVFFFEKGAAYYFHSHAFMAKFSIFIAVALLSIIPTREFLSWRKALKAGQAPSARPEKLRLIKKLLHGEMLAIVIILLCAAIMARGGWV
jgi:putative membrane protein